MLEPGEVPKSDLISIMLRELNEASRTSYPGRSWKGDVDAVYADISRIRSYGYEPPIDLRQGIRELIKEELLQANERNKDTSQKIE